MASTVLQCSLLNHLRLRQLQREVHVHLKPKCTDCHDLGSLRCSLLNHLWLRQLQRQVHVLLNHAAGAPAPAALQLVLHLQGGRMQRQRQAAGEQGGQTRASGRALLTPAIYRRQPACMSQRMCSAPRLSRGVGPPQSATHRHPTSPQRRSCGLQGLPSLRCAPEAAPGAAPALACMQIMRWLTAWGGTGPMAARQLSSNSERLPKSAEQQLPKSAEQWRCPRVGWGCGWCHTTGMCKCRHQHTHLSRQHLALQQVQQAAEQLVRVLQARRRRAHG